MSFAEWLSLVHPEDRERMRKSYGDFQRETKPFESEFRVIWPDGSVHWLLGKTNVSQWDATGRPTRVAGISLDITRLKQAEQARREFEERFRLLIEHGSEVIGVIDPSATVRYLSPSAERVLGFPAGSLIGSNAIALVHPEDQATVQQTMSTILQAPFRSASVQYRARHGDGTWRHAEATATNCLHVEGLHGIVINVRDITPQKLFEEQLQASRHQLRQLAAAIEAAREQERVRVAREIHDELGQMLTVLKLGVEGLPFHRRRGVNAVQSLAERVAGLARHIDVALNTVHRIAAELRPSILNDLGLGAAMKWQIQEFEARTGIRCRCRGLGEGLRLGADQSLAVFRIFQEVLTNVVRHAGANEVGIRVTVKDNRLNLRVADDGKGMHPRSLTDSRSLGLIGMRERAVLLGGSVEFSSRRGGGTIVTVEVPVASGDPRPRPGARSGK
jgi:PAS domain S-box-containing protein